MPYSYPLNNKLRWARYKRADLDRQLLVLKQRRFCKKGSAEVRYLTLPSNLNVACLSNATTGVFGIYVYDAVGGCVFSSRSSWIRRVIYYKSFRTLAVIYADRMPFNAIIWADYARAVRSFHTLFVSRIRMRGRLYRIYKRNRYRDLQYRIGFSHRITIYVEGLYLRYIRKKRIRMLGLDASHALAKAREARDAYPVCKYTQRGVRRGGDRTFTRIGKTMKFY